jgi:hypothetical protein
MWMFLIWALPRPGFSKWVQFLLPCKVRLLSGERTLFKRLCFTMRVTNLQGPPLERMQTEKLQDLKKLAQQYARDWGSCDDVQISYLEILEDRDDDNLRLAQMISG